MEYIGWLRQRVATIGAPDYKPVLHLDVYGNLGLAFTNNMEAVAEYMVKAAEAAYPLQLRIEGPVDMEGRDLQIEALAELRHRVEALGSNGKCRRRWCNTLEDIKAFADNRAGHMLRIKTPI